MNGEDDFPQFLGPIVQWPRYGAAYAGEQFTISPVPTDDGRWLLTINDWSDSQTFYPTVVNAIDAALAIIKDSVDARRAGVAPESVQPAGGEAPAANRRQSRGRASSTNTKRGTNAKPGSTAKPRKTDSKPARRRATN